MTNTPAPEVTDPVAVALDMMLEHWVQGTAPTDAEGKQATAALMNYHAHPPQPDALAKGEVEDEMTQQLRQLATKEIGVGMSYSDPVRGGMASINLYGERAKAAIWLFNNATRIADRFATLQTDAKADALVEENGRLRSEIERLADLSERWTDSLVSQINKIARAALATNGEG